MWINLGQLSPYTSGPQTVAPFFLGRGSGRETMISLAPRIGFRMVFGIEIVLIERSQGAEACGTTDSPEEDIGRLDTLGRILASASSCLTRKTRKTRSLKSASAP